MMRSGNPALNKKTFENLTNTSGGVMTLDGTVNKTALGLLLLMCAAYYTYSSQNLSLIWPGFIGGFIVAIDYYFQERMVSYYSPYLCSFGRSCSRGNFKCL